LALLERENERLRKLLDSSKQLDNEHVLIAEILSVDLHPYKQVISINKGERHGAYRGQPIVGAMGVIGQLIEIYPMHSTALLISDPNHSLLAESNRTNLRALLVGNGHAKYLSLKNISSSADIRIGDLFHTSGLDGLYPPNYPIAEVISINSLPGVPFLEVEARPLVELNQIREVLLIWNNTNSSTSDEAVKR
jgi:rod shape-determining protein MreC